MLNQLEVNWLGIEIPKPSRNEDQKLFEGERSSSNPLFKRFLKNCPQQSQITQNA